jgi:hypothetical protein
VKWISSTLDLFGAALRDGARAYGRGLVGALGLLIGGAFLALISKVLDPVVASGGAAGRFLFGFLFATLTAYVVGAYLATVQAALDARKPLGPSILKEAIGHYFSETISVMFWLWITSFVVSILLPGMLGAIFWFVAAILLNPIPELIYNGRRPAPGIFEDSARWIWSNWPEWLVPQFLAALVVGAVLPQLASIVGPWGGTSFGFLSGIVALTEQTASQALARGSPLWRVLLEALLVPLIVHAVMVFRGALFRKLGSGSRRSRAWRARFDRTP